MTNQDSESRTIRTNSSASVSTQRIPRHVKEDQYLHLVRLAWDLHKLGLSAMVELPTGKEPALLVSRAAGPLRIMALRFKGTWFFTWGRGDGQRVRALSSEASNRVWEMAQ